MKEKNKIGLTLLVLLGVGSMIGGGIFNSPTDLIRVANPQAVVISWMIGGIGIVSLGYSFYLLSNRRPHLNAGIFSYAKELLGQYTGFTSSWGYWVSTWLGNVALFILIFKTLGSVVSITPMQSFLMASTLLWIIFMIQINGAKGAGLINAVITIAKLIPIILAILLGIFVFNKDIFNVPNWQSVFAYSGESTNLMSQISGSMGTILWCFVGVEAISVLSDKVEKKEIVGKATVISLLITLAVYMGISIIAMGVVPAEVLGNTDTAFAEILSRTALGTYGVIIAKGGLIVSLVGASLSWVMVSVEAPYISAKAGFMPKYFLKTNKNGTPTNALIITTILTNIAMFSILSSALQDMYYVIYNMATAAMLIPYLFSGLYALKVSNEDKLKTWQKVIISISIVYSIYVLCAVGIAYISGVVILYAIGILVYIPYKKELGQKLTKPEVVIMSALLISSLIISVLFVNGTLVL